MFSAKGWARAIALITLLLSLSGCAIFKARAIASTDFLPHGEQLVEMTERAPFNGIFVSDPLRFDQAIATRRKLAVLPVNSKFAEARINESDLPASVKRQRVEELHEMARYLRERLKNSLSEYVPMDGQAVPGQASGEAWFTIEDTPSADALVIELALVEVVPTNPGINVVATVGGFLVPGGGLVRLLGTGSVAIEGLVRDGSTSEVIFEFKDREADKTTPFSVKDFQQYAHARETIDEWSMQLTEIVATPSTHMVDDSSPLSINPL